jgi:hypothetical protein
MRKLTNTISELTLPALLLAGFFALPFYTIAALNA